MLIFLAVSFAPLAYAPAQVPSTGKMTCLLTLDVCNHGGGLAVRSMPFIPVFANKIPRMDFSHFLAAETREFTPLLLSVLKERPPEITSLP